MVNLRWVLTALPILWMYLFSFQELSVLLLVGALLFFGGGGTRRNRFPGGELVRVTVSATFLSLLYAPLFRLAQETWLIPVGAITVVLLILFSLLQTPLASLSGDRTGKITLLVGLSVGVPLALGAVPTFLLEFSPQSPPSELIPWQGWITSIWTLFFWGGVSLLFFPRDRPGERGWWGLTLLCLLAISTSMVYRINDLNSTFENLTSESSARVSDWERLMERTKSVGFPGQEERMLETALQSPAFRQSEPAWISWAKELNPDPKSFLKPFPLKRRLLAVGGKPFEEEIEPGTGDFVGLEIDPNHLEIYLLTESGYLTTIGDSMKQRKIEPEVGPLVHLCLGIHGEPVLLEAGGRVVSVTGTSIHEIIPTHFGPEAAFLIRLAVDRQAGVFWGLDRFGVLYRSDPKSREWIRDERFLPHAKTPDGDFPTAQDIAVTSDGTLYFLDCFGQVWSSTKDGSKVVGPDRGAHYFPDFPVAQSLGVDGHTLEIVDRYGGFFPSPYPTDRETLRLRESHLFPRSLPRRTPEVVDHVFLPEHRWLYLLTKSGRILTNKKWYSYWAR